MFRRLGIAAAVVWLYCVIFSGSVSASPFDGAGEENAVKCAVPAAETFCVQGQCEGEAELILLSGDGKMTYVLNSKSMKFHYPSCTSAKKMNNPQTYTGYRDDLIKKGYSPCGRCKP